MSTFIDNNPIIVFLVPVGLGMLALAFAGNLYLILRRFRRDQKIVMGESHEHDIVAHARAVQQRVDGLAHEIRELTSRLELDERRLDDCLTYRSVVRYDAYRDLSGMQSTSVCLIDARFSGIIISSIQSRDHARIYVKQIRHGDSREKLSPEEIQVLKEAMGLKKLVEKQKAAGGGTGV